MKSYDKQMRNNTAMNNNGTMNGDMTNNFTLNNNFTNNHTVSANLTIHNNMTSNGMSTINVTDVSNQTKSSSRKSLSHIQIYHINEGESGNLSCSVISNPAANFKWNKNMNETYGEGYIIVFNNIKREDAGLYVCTAINMVGNRSSTASRIVVRCKYSMFIRLNVKVINF